MIVRTAAVAVLVIASTATADRPESNTTLTGYATFGGQPHADRGSVRFIVQGAADIGDACPDADAGQFVATYDGELEIAPGGGFEAALYPSAIATPSGCPVTDLHDVHVRGTQIVARLGALVGRGALTYQNLVGADETDLMRGAFDNLSARIVFEPEGSCSSCGS